MKKLKSVLLLFISCYLYFPSFSQDTASCNLHISLLTCSPGEDLYSLFGHTAIRVKDEAAHTDIIYNYGTFDFTDPDFYIKFVKGKLLYFVSTESLNDFLSEYVYEQRGVIEQTLRLTCEEKLRLNHALQENAREENKYYFYEFLFDNCSTRVRDMVSQNMNDSLQLKNILSFPPPSFRKILHRALDNGGQYWSKLGIDMLLGRLIDRPPTNREVMFMPDYLMKEFDSASVKGLPIVSGKKTMLFPAIKKNEEKSVFTPLNITVLLLLVVGWLTFINTKRTQKFLNVFDVIFFFITGGIGCFLIFMWFGTEHDLCADNYNLLWALPTHLPISFFLLKKKRWIRQYFTLSSVFYLLLLAAWAFLPQEMNPALLPVTALLGVRSFARSRKNKQHD